jgi:diaminohydroxyphosphoribosylaminopyrimidine deaminase/5-amino-6-(5-phosphoribosylamino)uracil reductase
MNPKQVALDQFWMRQALREARKGLGRTSPNPAVGAVLVKNGRLLSKGYHHAAGKPHAEIEALRALHNPKLARQATLYVTLEPCSTTGRTPPCTSAITEAGITRVVYGATDPNPAHQGRAQKILQAAGVSVTTGILEKSCTSLNQRWNYFIRTGLPWVLLKSGLSLDGRIVPGENQPWVTSTAARADANRLRATVDAILVGGETIRRDNPRLTLRHPRSGKTLPQSPRRIVWSQSSKFPDPRYEIFSDALANQTLLCRARTWKGVLQFLAHQGITSVLVEGGGTVAGAAVDAKLVNEIVFYFAPKFLGGPVPAVRGLGVASPIHALRLTSPKIRRLGPDLRYSANVIF